MGIDADLSIVSIVDTLFKKYSATGINIRSLCLRRHSQQAKLIPVDLMIFVFLLFRTDYSRLLT